MLCQYISNSAVGMEVLKSSSITVVPDLKALITRFLSHTKILSGVKWNTCKHYMTSPERVLRDI